MALGGGTFVSQNKVLPGSYINFISISAARSALGERGTVAMGLELDWGIDSELFKVTRADFQTKSREIFGYNYDHDKLKGLRDLFKNTHTLIAYRLTSGGVQAQNEIATAKYNGIRGNNLKIQVQQSVDNVEEFKVATLLDNVIVDEQVVAEIGELVPNEFVTFKNTGTLTVQAGTPLTGGKNGTVDGSSHSDFLAKAETQAFNVIAVVTEEETINKLYAAFTERMRDDRGQKFQVVLYRTAGDYEGVINVKNKVLDDVNKASSVYWVAGVQASKPVNQTAMNDIYDGEYEIDVEYTQAELEQAIRAGEFTLHRVGDDIRVLKDINSLVTTSENKGEVFKDNKTIRIIDQIANDIAQMFASKYMGEIPNDQSGRVSLQADIVSHHEELQDIRAIENFSESDVSVEQGADKTSVVINDEITPTRSMEKLYMSVVVA